MNKLSPLDENQIRRVAYLKTYGALECIASWLIKGFFFVILMQITLFYFNPPAVDDCDISASERCGMRVYRDNLTGLEYLATSTGNLTPRLRADGSQVRK